MHSRPAHAIGPRLVRFHRAASESSCGRTWNGSTMSRFLVDAAVASSRVLGDENSRRNVQNVRAHSAALLNATHRDATHHNCQARIRFEEWVGLAVLMP